VSDQPVWLRESLLAAVHDRLLAEHGGPPGLRSREGLEAALARPRHVAVYQSTDLFDLAAAYAGGLVRNHPFLDGNKRTAFMAAYVFLGRNGIALVADEADAVRAMVALASGDLSEPAFSAWLRQNSRNRA
jgi:death-on-curing protein